MTPSRSPRSRLSGRTLALMTALPTILVGLWILWGTATPTTAPRETPITFPHIHGMGWLADGTQFVVAAHDGTRIYMATDQRWGIPDAPRHDLMGYTPIEHGFYSSGHPDLTTGLPNPLGLVKSTDGGKTLTTVGFAGERDFHLLGAGYFSQALYVVNPTPTAQLGAGLATSFDEGRTWIVRRAAGLLAPPLQVAVHPRDPHQVAIATEAGLFVSGDAGETFTRLGEAVPVTAVAWSPVSGQLLFGGGQLTRYDPQTQTQTTLPGPTATLLTAIAPHPTEPDDLVLATQERDIYRTPDDGQTWQPLARGGIGTTGP